MTNEKIIETAEAVMRELCADLEIPEKLLQDVKANPHSYYSLPGRMSALAFICEVQADALQAVERKEGRGAMITAAKHIFKAGAVTNRPCFSYYWEEDGLQIICSSFHCARLSAPLQGLPKLPDNIEPLHVSGIFASCQKNNGPRLDLPSIGALKAHIAKEKGSNPGKYTGRNAKPVLYDFGDGLPAVNASFLMDLLQLLPGAFAICGERISSPLYITGSAAGDGLLCPVRKNGGPV